MMGVSRTLRLLLFAATLTTCAPPALGSPFQATEELEARIRRVEGGLMPAGAPADGNTANLTDRMAQYRVPAVSVAVIEGGRIEWAKAYGVADYARATPATPRTLFQAASISKPVAAMAALRLVEEGILQLDEDINQKLILWKVPENEFTAKSKVTLRRILSHSAGLTVRSFPGYASGSRIPSLLNVLRGEPPANTPPVLVDIEPGSHWRYSGGGFCVLQQLVTDVTGKPFAQFMRDTVLQRLGMQNSTYEQPLPPALSERAAAGHDSEGHPVDGQWHVHPEMAAAGLWTTPSDLARFAIELQEACAGRSHKVLSQDTAQEMLTLQSGPSGLGIMVEGSGPSAFFLHGGSNRGFRCTLIATVHGGQGAAVMTNSDNGAELADEIVRSIAREYRWPESLKPR